MGTEREIKETKILQVLGKRYLFFLQDTSRY